MKDKLYKMMSWPEIEAIVYGEISNPQTVLGRQSVMTHTLFQTFIPNAKSVKLCISDDKKAHNMEEADEAGFFAASVLGKESRDYVYKVTFKDGREKTIHDPYNYDPRMSIDDAKSWNKGTSLNAYEFMGSHVTEIEKVPGVIFRVWAPNAIRVSVIGDFNEWNGLAHPMILDEETGVFSLFIPELTEGAKYLYEVCIKGNETCCKADPYAVKSDDEGNSVVTVVDEFAWDDKNKSTQNDSENIVNIFEIDDNLWNESSDLDDKRIDELCEYAVDLEYNYVLINAISNRLFCLNNIVDAVSLKKLVNKLHSKKIKVLFKWNGTSFDIDDKGMKIFDGTYLYGHLDENKRYNVFFGYNYNYAREQVKNLLLSNVNYWFEQFHIDGLYVDEISTVLYLDYGKTDGQWTPNMYGGNENIDAIEFFKQLNEVFHKKYNGCTMITKETCMFPKVTASIKEGGLGFDYIFDNGFSEDYIDFIKNGCSDITKITDSMSYAYSEKYILTMSKEDVLIMNDNDLEALWGGAGYFDNCKVDDVTKMKLKRATLSFINARPGKKLVFLGQDEKNLSKELNSLYKNMPAFNALDEVPSGFEWIYSFAGDNGVVAFLRNSEIFKESVLVICNFSNNEYSEFKLGVPYEGKYKSFFCSEEDRFGGDVKLSKNQIETVDEDYDGRECTLTVELPAMSVSYYTYTPYTEEEFLKSAAKKAEKIRKELENEAQRRAKELEREALRKAKEYNSLAKRK